MHTPEDHGREEHADDGPGNNAGGEGAAVFPLIPPELHIQPLLLALLHSMVFIDGSTDEVIDPEAADEAMQYIVTYLHRLKGPTLKQLQEDLACLLDFAKQQGWPKQQQTFIKSFLKDYAIGEP
jgi:hypothetical protein